MTGLRLRVTLLVLVVALAGCTFGVQGPTVAPTAESATDATSQESPATSTGSDVVTLENSSLDLDAERTFERIERFVDEDVDSPPVWVYESGGPGGGGGITLEYPYTPYGFVEHLDLTNVSGNGLSAAGLTTADGEVYVVPRNSSGHDVEQVLAHEFVHVVQFRADLLPWQGNAGGDVTTDLAQTRQALVEGAAVWVTDDYTEQYLPPNVTLQSAVMAESYEESRVGGRYFLARYRFGAMGIDRRFDDPSQLRDIYESPPNTSEQLIHGYAPGEEPPRPVPVEASGGDGWELADPDDEDVMGELFVRVALSRELSTDAAADAAAGWGYDRLVEYERDDTDAFAWVTRWDDPANATAFHDALETYVDGRTTPADLAFRAERVSDEVVVFYTGPPAFVEAAETTGDAEGVRVTVAD